jgi:glycosyltransferase involved in cell wall biosynthesis
MIILHIAYSLNEQSAAYRLAEEQAINQGHQIHFLLARKSTSSFVESRRIFPFLTSFIGFTTHLFDYILRKCLVRGDDVFSMGINFYFKDWIFEKMINKFNPDVIHIHWGGYSFIPSVVLGKLSRNIQSRFIVTIHDYYYFTGGCHIPLACTEHRNDCQNCPKAKNVFAKNWIKSNKTHINNLLSNTKISFVAPSFYTSNYLNSIFLNFNCRVIPNTVGNMYLLNKMELGNIFSVYKHYRFLNKNIPTILIVGIKNSSDQNKGSDIIFELMNVMYKMGVVFNLITVGDYLNLDISGTHLHFRHKNIEEMKQLYAITDLCIVPSRYETFSQVTLESIQLTTPVVAFDLTGPKDIIKNGFSGFLTPPFNVGEFSKTIIENLNYKFTNEEMMIEYAFITSSQFSPMAVALMYQDLYEERNVDIFNND